MIPLFSLIVFRRQLSKTLIQNGAVKAQKEPSAPILVIYGTIKRTKEGKRHMDTHESTEPCDKSVASVHKPVFGEYNCHLARKIIKL